MDRDAVMEFAMEHAMEMAFLFDSDGKILYANQTAREHLEYGDAERTWTMRDVFPAEFPEEGADPGGMSGMGDEVCEMVAYRGNRTCFPVKARLLTKEPGTYVCLAVDASRENFMEKRVAKAGQEMESAQKVKSEFVANVTHELRTPVNGILGNTRELIEMETSEEKKRLLRLVERGCNDMHAIINSILDFSKLEAGKFSLELREFNFRNMLDYVKSNHSNKITEKGLEFFVTISPEVPEVIIGDELRIVQILNNLLSNACKFTSVGKIMVEVVKTAQMGSRVELFFMVIDTGIGIEKTDQDKLFKSFSQVDASISRRFGGTGLGLNICKQLVELMDGNIRVESEKGKGSIFSFHIWVEVPGGGAADQQPQQAEIPTVSYTPHSLAEMEETQEIWQYGSPQNQKEIRQKLSKLILSVEMENWEKAEMFAETIKQLTREAPPEIKSVALRLKMAVQKGDYEKVTTQHEALVKLI